jgi:hypothetical protein
MNPKPKYATLEMFIKKDTTSSEEEDTAVLKQENITTTTTATSTPSKNIHPFFRQGFGKSTTTTPTSKKKAIVPPTSPPSEKDEKLERTVTIDGLSQDSIIATVSDIFLSDEQKKRKRELKNLQTFQKNIETSKQMNPLFCKPFTGDKSQHPLLNSSKQQQQSRKSTSNALHTTDPSLQVADFVCDPLPNVSQAKEWTHGPAIHINSLPWNSSTEYTSMIDNDENDQISEIQIEDNWWWSNDFTKVNEAKLQQKQSTNIEEISPVVQTDLSAIVTKYLNSMKDRLRNNLSIDLTCGMGQAQIMSIFRKLIERKISANTQTFDLTSSALWTHKYRPLSRDEILNNNSDSIAELWSWMTGWEKYRQSIKDQSKRSSEKRDNKKTAACLFFDDEDWQSGSGSDSEDEGFDPADNNLIMISGGLSSGKSAAVYACAHELGAHVFEINSASDRSQASVCKLTEATQSHQINKFFKKTAASENNSVSEAKPQSSSLLLFEEVDNLFEQDKGFFAGIKKIQRTTKRPLILTSNETIEIEDLSMCKQLHFSSLGLGMDSSVLTIWDSILRKSQFLHLVLLCEGFELQLKGDIIELVACLKGDLRSVLLNLQFWLEDQNKLPVHMDEILNKPVDMTFKPVRRLSEQCLGIQHLSEHLLNPDTIRSREYYHVWDDELITSRDNDYDLMFNNYLNGSMNSTNELQQLQDISKYMETLSFFDSHYSKPDIDDFADKVSNCLKQTFSLTQFHIDLFNGRASKPCWIHSKKLFFKVSSF